MGRWWVVLIKPSLETEFTEPVDCSCFSKYEFLKISQYSQESTCVGVSL